MTLRKLLPYSIACLLTALPILSGCMDGGMADVSLPHEEADGSGVYVSVVVNTDGGARTRTIGSPTPGEDGDGEWPGESNENAVHNLYLYFFDGGEDENGKRKGINADGNISIIGPVEFTLGNSLYGAGTRYYTEPREIDGMKIGKTYDVLAITNLDGVKMSMNFNTLGELRDAASAEAITHTTENMAWFVMSSANPTFDAENGINSVKIEGNNSINNPATVNIDVERLAARIDCHVKTGGKYEVEGTGGDKVVLQELVTVNKYTMNDKNLATKGDYERSYWFKRVSEGIELTAGMAVNYLGDELPVDETGPATNYVIGPMTLTPPDIQEREDGQQPYDHSFYYNKNNMSHWEKNWVPIDELESEITSEQGGITFHRLDYVEENILPAEMLTDPTNREYYCTGVMFKAQYTPAGFTEGDTFYWYDNQAFASLDKVKEYSTAVNAITDLSDENCAQYGILKYEEGICYYTYWIRHADDGDPDKISPMEYAIVRNNIYQVEVASITTIGSPEPEDEVNAAIKVYVVNWDATSIKTEDVVWGDPIPSN